MSLLHQLEFAVNILLCIYSYSFTHIQTLQLGLNQFFFNHVVFQIELQFWNIGSISPRVLFPLTGASDTEI